MNEHQHPSNNAVLGAPQGWDQGALPCSALPITRRNVDGFACADSYWKPTAEDLAVLNAGGSVVLSVLGTVMPGLRPHRADNAGVHDEDILSAPPIESKR